MAKFDNNPLEYSTQSYQLNDRFQYSSHIHTYHELIYFMQGNAIYSNEEKSYHLKKGDLVITRPFSYHCISFPQDNIYTRVNILFDANRLAHPEIVNCINHLDVLNCNHLPVIGEIMKQLEYHKQTASEEDFPEIANLLIEQIFWTLKSSPLSPSSTIEEIDQKHILAPIIEYINDHITTVEGIEEICQELHISKSYLHKLFKTTLKTTPAKYIHSKRLLYAKRMIETGKRPTEICYEFGYTEYSTFYRNYVKFFGTPPKQTIKTPYQPSDIFAKKD